MKRKRGFIGLGIIILGSLGLIVEFLAPEFIRVSCIDSIGSNYSYYFIYLLIILIGFKIQKAKNDQTKKEIISAIDSKRNNMSMSALNQDWLELITTLKWLIKENDEVLLGKEDSLQLSVQFKGTFPIMSKLLNSARILNLKINGVSYKIYGWTSKSDIRCGWINKFESKTREDLTLIPEHRLLLNEIGGIWESFNQPEPSLTLNQEYMFIESNCNLGIGGWDDYYDLVCKQDNHPKLNFSNFISFVKEANGDVTLYDPDTKKVMLFAHDHCNQNLISIPNQPEYTFYKINKVDTFIDYVECLAQEWLEHTTL